MSQVLTKKSDTLTFCRLIVCMQLGSFPVKQMCRPSQYKFSIPKSILKTLETLAYLLIKLK